MARNIVGFIVGLTAAGFTVWAISMINYSLFPMPEGLDLNDKEAMNEYASNLPMLAYTVVLVAHIVGAFVGAWVGSIIADNNEYKISVGIGLFLLVMGVINLFLIPHPTWFMIVDIAIYLPAALLGHRFYLMMRR